VIEQGIWRAEKRLVPAVSPQGKAVSGFFSSSECQFERQFCVARHLKRG
jgi:hypothetical protein